MIILVLVDFVVVRDVALCARENPPRLISFYLNCLGDYCYSNANPYDIVYIHYAGSGQQFLLVCPLSKYIRPF